MESNAMNFFTSFNELAAYQERLDATDVPQWANVEHIGVSQTSEKATGRLKLNSGLRRRRDRIGAIRSSASWNTVSRWTRFPAACRTIRWTLAH